LRAIAYYRGVGSHDQQSPARLELVRNLDQRQLEAARTGNWFLENNLVIARLDKLSRNEDVQLSPIAVRTSSYATRRTRCRRPIFIALNSVQRPQRCDAYGPQFSRSSRNSDAGLTPVTNRWSRARVHAT